MNEFGLDLFTGFAVLAAFGLLTAAIQGLRVWLLGKHSLGDSLSWGLVIVSGLVLIALIGAIVRRVIA